MQILINLKGIRIILLPQDHLCPIYFCFTLIYGKYERNRINWIYKSWYFVIESILQPQNNLLFLVIENMKNFKTFSWVEKTEMVHPVPFDDYEIQLYINSRHMKLVAPSCTGVDWTIPVVDQTSHCVSKKMPIFGKKYIQTLKVYFNITWSYLDLWPNPWYVLNA